MISVIIGKVWAILAKIRLELGFSVPGLQLSNPGIESLGKKDRDPGIDIDTTRVVVHLNLNSYI